MQLTSGCALFRVFPAMTQYGYGYGYQQYGYGQVAATPAVGYASSYQQRMPYTGTTQTAQPTTPQPSVGYSPYTSAASSVPTTISQQQQQHQQQQPRPVQTPSQQFHPHQHQHHQQQQQQQQPKSLPPPPPGQLPQNGISV